MPKHDFAGLRSLPILHVAQALGLMLKRTGSGTWNVKDSDDSLGYTSLTVFETTNTWHRFSGKESGGVHRGSPIDLVCHVRDCSFKEAVEFLSSRFL